MVRVRARNAEATGPWSDATEATTGTAPTGAVRMVSNTGLVASGTGYGHWRDSVKGGLARNPVGGSFTTGSHSGGYRLSHVELDFHLAPVDVEVKLTSTLSSTPNVVARLGAPLSTSAGIVRFAAAEEIVLEPSTTYYV